MHCIVLMRYSVWTRTGARSWMLGRTQDAEQYREKLFSPARLDAHQFLFEHLALPSLLNQTRPVSKDWFRLIVFTSAALPQPYGSRLRSLLEMHDWARIVAVEPGQPFDACAPVPEVVAEFAGGAGTCHATVRLDDDDALSDEFLAELEPYVQPEFAGFCVSFPSGYSAVFDTNKRQLGPCFAQYCPKIALGLAMIHGPLADARDPEAAIRCIHQAGDHDRIDTRFPLILDARRPAFLRSLHEFSDSFRADRAPPGSRHSISAGRVRERFTLDPALLAK